jgi:hypothetical protein
MPWPSHNSPASSATPAFARRAEILRRKNLPGSARILQNAKDQVNACIQVRDLQQSNLATFLGR